MKLDIEGMEIEAVSDLLLAGAVKFINTLFIECHSRNQALRDRVKSSNLLETTMKSLSEFCENVRKNKQEISCDFTLSNIDDETYGTSYYSLPNC